MADTHGPWKSADVVVYHYVTEDELELDIIYRYRHALMSRFVSDTYGGDIESTRVICFQTLDGKSINVDFEFTLKPDERRLTPEYLLTKSGFDRIVGRLFKAVQADDALEQAKEEARRYTF